ncbi:hypothetical protein [Siminovitchia sp. FSL W7-1587]
MLMPGQAKFQGTKAFYSADCSLSQSGGYWLFAPIVYFFRILSAKGLTAG